MFTISELKHKQKKTWCVYGHWNKTPLSVWVECTHLLSIKSQRCSLIFFLKWNIDRLFQSKRESLNFEEGLVENQMYMKLLFPSKKFRVQKLKHEIVQNKRKYSSQRRLNQCLTVNGEWNKKWNKIENKEINMKIICLTCMFVLKKSVAMEIVHIFRVARFMYCRMFRLQLKVEN